MSEHDHGSAECDAAITTVTSPVHAFPASGCWINIMNPVVGELVGRCGYDYALIDMEHSPATLESALPVIRAVQATGTKALVRVPDKHPAWIGRLMDAGADGVMVPMVNSAEEAERLAKAAQYAPAGTRGMAAGIVRGSGYGVDIAHYLEHYREQFLLMVQIETQEAVAAAGEIAHVEGVDCVFIGPYDLSGSLGNLGQPEHAATREAIAKVMEAVMPSGTLLSTLTNPERDASVLFAEGYGLVFSGSDIGMLRDALLADTELSQSVIQGLAGKT